MKPRLLERLLTASYALLTAAAGMFLAANSVWNWININEYLNPSAGFSFVIGLVILIAMAAWGIFIVYRNLKWTRSRRTGFVGIQNAEKGDVLIAVSALHGLASKAASSIEGVTCKKIRVIEHAEAISLRIKTSVKGDMNIPETTAELQRVIRAQIESYSGIEVSDIKVIITDIAPAADKIISAPVVPVQAEAPVEEIYYESEPAVREEESSDGAQDGIVEEEVEEAAFETVEETFDEADMVFEEAVESEEEAVQEDAEGVDGDGDAGKREGSAT